MSELYPPTRTESLLSALAELVPLGIGASVKTLLVDSAHRQAAETGEVFRRVTQDVGEELFSRTVEESPRLRSLLLNAIDLCYRTSFEQKRWRLAEALKRKHYPAPITAVLVNSGLAKELPAYYTGGAEHTLVTEYGLRVLGDFRRLGMQLRCRGATSV